jgi:hypothetical protein
MCVRSSTCQATAAVLVARGFGERFQRVMPSPNETMVLIGEDATTSRNREDLNHDEEKTERRKF